MPFATLHSNKGVDVNKTEIQEIFRKHQLNRLGIAVADMAKDLIIQDHNASQSSILRTVLTDKEIEYAVHESAKILVSALNEMHSEQD